MTSISLPVVSRSLFFRVMTKISILPEQQIRHMFWRLRRVMSHRISLLRDCIRPSTTNLESIVDEIIVIT